MEQQSMDQDQSVALNQVPEDAVSIKREEVEDEDGEHELNIDNVSRNDQFDRSNDALDGNEAAIWNNLPYPTDGSDGQMSFYDHRRGVISSATTITIETVRRGQAMSSQFNSNIEHCPVPTSTSIGQHHQPLLVPCPEGPNSALSISTMRSATKGPSGSRAPSSSGPSRRIVKPRPSSGTLNGEVFGVLKGKKLKNSGGYVGTFEINCVRASFKGLLNGVHIESAQFSFEGSVSIAKFNGIFNGSITRDDDEDDTFVGTFMGRLIGTFGSIRNGTTVVSTAPSNVKVEQDDDDDDVQWIEPSPPKQPKSNLPIQPSSSSSAAFDQFTNNARTTIGNATMRTSPPIDESNRDYDEEEEDESYNQPIESTNQQQPPTDDQSNDHQLNDNHYQFDGTSNNNAPINDDQDRGRNDDNAVDDDELDEYDDDYDNDRLVGYNHQSALASSAESSAEPGDESTNNELDLPTQQPQSQARTSFQIVESEQPAALKRTQQAQLPPQIAPKRAKRTGTGTSGEQIDLSSAAFDQFTNASHSIGGNAAMQCSSSPLIHESNSGESNSQAIRSPDDDEEEDDDDDDTDQDEDEDDNDDDDYDDNDDEEDDDDDDTDQDEDEDDNDDDDYDDNDDEDNDDNDDYNDDDNDDHALDAQSALVNSAESNDNTDNDLDMPNRQQTRTSARIAEKEGKSSGLKGAQEQPLPPTMAPEVKRVSRTDSADTLERSDIRERSTKRRIIYLECTEPDCPSSTRIRTRTGTRIRPARFATYAELNLHKKEEHWLGQHSCFVVGCTELFTHKYLLTNHRKTVHQGATEYECPVCETKFATQKKASYHWNLHIKGKFVCTMCSCLQSMISLASAQAHLNDPTISCEGSTECGRQFSDLVTLINHQSGHYVNGKKLRFCKLNCDQLSCCSFNKQTMIEHLRSVHRVPMPLGTMNERLNSYTAIMTKILLDRKIREMPKQRKSKLPLQQQQPSTSSATLERLTRPSTSGTVPMRPSFDRLLESDDDDDDEDEEEEDLHIRAVPSTSQKAQGTQSRKSPKCITRDPTRK